MQVEDTELGPMGRRKPPTDSPPTYAEATWSSHLRSLTNPVSRPSSTTWYSELIPVLATIVVFTTIMGVAESICYAIYYTSFHSILPLNTIFIPLIGGGPLQVVLATLAFCCSCGRNRFLLALSALILALAILCGLAIPAASFVLNGRASSDTTAVTNALQAASPSVLSSFADEYQSCIYNIPDIPNNQTAYTPLDIAPEYLDKSCRYAAITCNVPVQSCIYTYKVYACSDSSQLQSIKGPCNTLARVAYQVKYDWNKLGKSVDAWAMGVWGFWFVVFVLFYVRVYFGGL